MDFLIRQKLENAMADEVNLPQIVDDGEKLVFKEYLQLQSIYNQDTSILNQGPHQNLIELDKNQFTETKEYPTASSIKSELIADLAEFEAYAKFDFKDLRAWKTREHIAEQANIGTPTVVPKRRQKKYEEVLSQAVLSIKREGFAVKDELLKNISTEELQNLYQPLMLGLEDSFRMIPCYNTKKAFSPKKPPAQA